MKKRKHIIAIFIYDENVSQFLSDALTFYTTISTPPGNALVSIAAASVTTAQTHVATARSAEAIVATGLHGSAAARDLDVAIVQTDVRNFVAIVQTAVNNAPDDLTALAIIKECGLHTRKLNSKTKAGFDVQNDETSAGTLDFIFKAAAKGLKVSYEVQESIDTISWLTVKVTPDSSSTYVHGKAAGAKLYYRGRIILSGKKGGAQAWMSPPATYIFVL
jgi:hypothetical protein